jgi:phosphoribosylanthranilate isomerase
MGTHHEYGRARLKVCCIGSVAEAELAIRCGAAGLGLVSSMPSGPGVISEEEIAEIAGRVPPCVATFLLTSAQDVEAIVDQQKRCGVDTIQLCDELRASEVGQLRRRLPGVRIVPVIHVVDATAIERAQELASVATALLLDSGNPNKAVKELGGTGRAHDWSISRRIRDAAGVPVFLAGGLHPENVADAIAAVNPYGVDVCSGVREQGMLSADRLGAFVKSMSSVQEG